MISANLPFFWDSQIHSAHAISFDFWTPPEADYAHPPLFNFTLMTIWYFFGVGLWSAHLLSALILLALFLLIKKGNYFSKTPYWIFLFEPILLSMSFQVSADLLLLLLYLLSLEALKNNKSLMLAISLSLLSLTSLRGIVLLIPLFLTYLNCSNRLRQNFYGFIIAALISSSWLVLHYAHAGWWISPPNASSHRSLIETSALFKNIVIFIWYCFDYGRWALFLSTGFLLLKLKYTYKSILPILWPLMILALITIPFTNPFGERYLLIPCILTLGLFWNLSEKWNHKAKLYLRIFVISSLLSGHLWTYPNTISQNWDSTLGHIVLIKQQEQFEKDFSLSKPSSAPFSFYPMLIPREYTHLNKEFSYIDIESCNQIIPDFFYSPLQNGLSDNTITKLEKEGKIHKSYAFGPWKSNWFKNIPCEWFNLR